MMSWFKKKNSEALEYTMANLARRCIFDYDDISWEVKAIHVYNWEDKSTTSEYECHSSSETIYIEKDEDEERSWLVSRKRNAHEINNLAIDMIRENSKAPARMEFEGRMYHLEDDSAAFFLKDGKGDEQELLVYDYEDDSEDYSLAIEQWGDSAFTASCGEYVEEYKFSNILPPPE
jgi:hypothetical protein